MIFKIHCNSIATTKMGKKKGEKKERKEEGMPIEM